MRQTRGSAFSHLFYIIVIGITVLSVICGLVFFGLNALTSIQTKTRISAQMESMLKTANERCVTVSNGSVSDKSDGQQTIDSVSGQTETIDLISYDTTELAYIKENIADNLSYTQKLYELENQLNSSNLLSFIYVLLSGTVIAVVTERAKKADEVAKKIEGSMQKIDQISEDVFSQFLYPLYMISMTIYEIQMSFSMAENEQKKQEILTTGVKQLNDLICVRMRRMFTDSEAWRAKIEDSDSLFRLEFGDEIGYIEQRLTSLENTIMPPQIQELVVNCRNRLVSCCDSIRPTLNALDKSKLTHACSEVEHIFELLQNTPPRNIKTVYNEHIVDFKRELCNIENIAGKQAKSINKIGKEIERIPSIVNEQETRIFLHGHFVDAKKHWLEEFDRLQQCMRNVK